MREEGRRRETVVRVERAGDEGSRSGGVGGVDWCWERTEGSGGEVNKR